MATSAPRRTGSTPELLTDRVRSVAAAWRDRDEEAVRAELRLLAQEAEVLSITTPLWPRDNVPQRQRIAAEARTGRLA